MRLRLAQTALLPLLMLCGCSFLSSKPSQFYTLEPTAPQGTVTATAGLPLGVDLVLPPGVNRKEIVTRRSNGQLEIRGREQWTALLEPLVAHTLTVDLANRLPNGTVIFPGQPLPDGPTRSLDVAVEQLAAGPGSNVTLDALCTLREPGKAPVVRHEHVSVEINSLDSASIAAGISKALAELADRLAKNAAQ